MPPGIYARTSAIARFWPKVNKTDACWLWTAYINPNGYGRFKYNGKLGSAHRFAYELTVGKIPEGLQLDHLCRVRNCVNPSHLEPVTNKENVLRGVGLTAVHARKTHCKQRHELAGDNLYIRPKGGRVCRTCKNEAEKRRRLKSNKTY